LTLSVGVFEYVNESSKSISANLVMFNEVFYWLVFQRSMINTIRICRLGSSKA